MAFLQNLPFRLGTTSYILPDEILPNARFLAGRVQDVELVLFEVDDGPNNLPDEATLSALGDLARRAGLSYTVHLPLDLRLGTEGEEAHLSMQKARRVIDCTRPLTPLSYIVHLDGREVRQDGSALALELWTRRALRSLEIVAGWAGGADRLAVENLETYPPGFWPRVLDRTPAGRCVDVGHLWLDGQDPLPYLDQSLPRTRVVHLHGIYAGRDHQSLAHVPPDELDRVARFLVERTFTGVVTLEIFGLDDFNASLAALDASLARIILTAWRKR